MSRHDQIDQITVDDAFQKLKVDDLKPLVALLDKEPPPRKPELVAVLTEAMHDPAKVRTLYERLDEISKAAVQEATHDPEGRLHLERFGPKYGQYPNFGKFFSEYRDPARPTLLRLFFPNYEQNYRTLPSDLWSLLLTFVRKPQPFTVGATDELPAAIQVPFYSWDSGKPQKDYEEVPLQVKETARDALNDVKAVLRLIDADSVRVSEKTRRPTAGSMKAILAVLHGGDFYAPEDDSERDDEPASDLTMKPFAWPLLVQAAGLAQVVGTKLQLTAAGRKATTKPSHEVIHFIWNKWRGTSILDEYNRVAAIKGQKGNLTPVAGRRQALVDTLAECPAKKWLEIEELFRLFKALGQGMEVARRSWHLYIAEHKYGSLSYEGEHFWELLQGRYLLALLFEYAGTLGLVDVAYISPDGARGDYQDRWGTDDLSCLSRYDGLQYVRINSLGAWCLGLADSYAPEAITAASFLKVLPNLEIVATDQPPPPADVLLLDRFTERQSNAVWRLTAPKMLQAVEDGLALEEFREFLSAKSEAPLPETVCVFLTDLQKRVEKLRDLGTARLLECADTGTAQLLANDRRLRKFCQLTGERSLVFPPADETAVRRGLRELGYVLPPQE